MMSRHHHSARVFLRGRVLPSILGLAGLLAVACGGGDEIELIPPPGSPTARPAATATAEPLAAPTELRVAYINLMSPLALDATNTTPSDTFEQRLWIVIEELKAFKPDLLAFSEVTDTKAHGKVASVLARELKMEPLYVRAKPWFAGTTQEQSDAIVKSAGFEEGELILVNGTRFPNSEGERKWLNPRTSEGEVAAALWMRLKGPEPVGVIDVFVSHLTGTDARVRTQQAADLAAFITSKRGTGPVIVLGDLGDPPGSATEKALLDAGLHDLLANSTIGTCCRESVVGEQPQLTVRHDYIFSSGWRTSELAVFGDQPKTLPDGTVVYASDHNGIRAAFPILASYLP
jgi:endonuclease/exonuclease/phosphatase family metal-dependent hydrolase